MKKILSQKNIIYLVGILMVILTLTFSFQGAKSSTREDKEFLKLLEEPPPLPVGEIAECKWLPIGTGIEKLLKMEEDAIDNFIEAKEQSEATFFHAENLAYWADDCKGKNCRSFCECLECVPCCPPPAPPCGVRCAYCDPHPCSGIPCNYREIEKEKEETLAANRRVRGEVKELENLEEKLKELKKVFIGIEKSLKEWYDDPKRGVEVLLLDCFEAKDQGVVKDCPSENDYYICWPKKK